MICVREDTKSTCVVDEPGYLSAWRAGGYLIVRRSGLIRDTDDLYAPVKAIIGDTEPCTREVLPDEEMMWGEVELLVFTLPEEGVAA